MSAQPAELADVGLSVRHAWRQWRVPLALIGVIVLGGIVIAIIGRLGPSLSNTYLDPASDASDGAHALTDILGERGDTVVRAYSTATALAALRAVAPGQGQGQAQGTSATLVVTSPYLLTERELTRLGRAGSDLLVVEPGRRALTALAPQVQLTEPAADFGLLLKPGCDLPAARMAGKANAGGASYQAPTSPSADGCYPLDGSPTIVRYRAAGRTITVMGSGAPFADGWLARNGNAALAINLLAAHRHVVWLTPEPSNAPPPPVRNGQASQGPALIPWQAWLVVIQLAIAAALTGLWRARRLGPLIAERLPVVVRASETVEGHAALYQYRHARDRAAAALREDMLARVVPVLGLETGAPEQAVTDAVAARSRQGRQEVARILFGQAPGTDLDLVNLARSLDELERQVCSQ